MVSSPARPPSILENQGYQQTKLGHPPFESTGLFAENQSKVRYSRCCLRPPRCGKFPSLRSMLVQRGLYLRGRRIGSCDSKILIAMARRNGWLQADNGPQYENRRRKDKNRYTCFRESIHFLFHPPLVCDQLSRHLCNVIEQRGGPQRTRTSLPRYSPYFWPLVLNL